MKKKGMESVWIVIMLVLALIVLVVLTALITGQAGKFGAMLKKSVKTCGDTDVGGDRVLAAEGCSSSEQQVYGVEVSAGYICCKKTGQ